MLYSSCDASLILCSGSDFSPETSGGLLLGWIGGMVTKLCMLLPYVGTQVMTVPHGASVYHLEAALGVTTANKKQIDALADTAIHTNVQTHKTQLYTQ